MIWYGFGVLTAPLWFIIITLLLEAAWLTKCAANDQVGRGFLSLLFVMIGLHVFGVFNTLEWAWSPYSLIFIVVYAVLGVLWARYGKWKFVLSDWASRARTLKYDWLVQAGISGTEVPPEREGEWVRYARSNKRVFVAPRVWDYKHRFLSWSAWWPFSFFWTMLNDPLRKFYEWAYRSFMKSMQADADRAAAEFAGDLKLIDRDAK